MAIPVNQLDLGALAALANARPTFLNLPLHGVEIGNLFSGRAEGIYKALDYLNQERTNNLQAQLQREGYVNQVDVAKLQEAGANQRTDKSIFYNERLQQQRISAEQEQAVLDRILKEKELANQSQYQSGVLQNQAMQNQIGMENANTSRMDMLNQYRDRQQQLFNEKFKQDFEIAKQWKEDKRDNIGALGATISTIIGQGGDPKDINTKINNLIDSVPVDVLSAKEKNQYKNLSLSQKQDMATYGIVLAYGSKLANSPGGALTPWVQNTGATPLTKEQTGKVQEDIRQNESLINLANDTLQFIDKHPGAFTNEARRVSSYADFAENEPKTSAVEGLAKLAGYGKKERDTTDPLVDEGRTYLGQLRLKYAETVSARLAGNPAAQKQFDALLPQDHDDPSTLRTKIVAMNKFLGASNEQNKDYLTRGISTESKPSEETTFSYKGRNFDITKWKAQNQGATTEDIKNFIRSKY